MPKASTMMKQVFGIGAAPKRARRRYAKKLAASACVPCGKAMAASACRSGRGRFKACKPKRRKSSSKRRCRTAKGRFKRC